MYYGFYVLCGCIEVMVIYIRLSKLNFKYGLDRKFLDLCFIEGLLLVYGVVLMENFFFVRLEIFYN